MGRPNTSTVLCCHLSFFFLSLSLFLSQAFLFLSIHLAHILSHFHFLLCNSFLVFEFQSLIYFFIFFKFLFLFFSTFFYILCWYFSPYISLAFSAHVSFLSLCESFSLHVLVCSFSAFFLPVLQNLLCLCLKMANFTFSH